MREIEVKTKLRDERAFLDAAEQLGIVFGDVMTQEDTTFTNGVAYDDPAWNIFRLRKQSGKFILTMKHKASARSRDNYEYETIVANYDEAQKMLERLGYSFDVNIKKERRKANYNGLEICLDIVDRLGLFAEVEKLADETADVDTIQSELWDLLISLGAVPEDRVHKGYDTLMRDYNSQQL